jgi:hypothetical protein
MPIFEASLAAGFLIRTETRPSTIPGAGAGVFALEDVARGTFVGMDFPDPKKACTADEVLALPRELRMFSWRHVEHVCFAAAGQRTSTDLMNHSFTPNVLWHVGHYFTLADVGAGDELFLDYRHLLAPSWNDRLFDGASRRAVNGLEWREAVRSSCRQLLALLEDHGP